MLDICYNSLVIKNPWKDYITAKYLHWRADKYGRSGSAAMFARAIGISPQLLSAWMNKGQIPTDQETINLLVNYFGFEVYDSLNLPRPTEPLEVFPPAVRAALEFAMSQIVAGGFDADSPEAVKIFDEAIIALGYKRISSLDTESSE